MQQGAHDDVQHGMHRLRFGGQPYKKKPSGVDPFKARKEKNFLDALSNAGPAVRLYGEGRAGVNN